MSDKVVFIDGEKLCLYDDGKIIERDSRFLENYRNNLRRMETSTKWKYEGNGAMFRGEPDRLQGALDSGAYGLNGVCFMEGDLDIVAYTFTTPQSSGVYLKNFSMTDEKDTNDEKHLYHTDKQRFYGVERGHGCLVCSVSEVNGEESCARGLYKLTGGGNYCSLTGGDSKDDHPSYSKNGKLLYASAGIGRTPDGAFGEYAPTGIYQMDEETGEITPIKESEEFSYTRPQQDGEGNIYAIKRPVEQRKSGNGSCLVNLLLLPARLIVVLVMLLQYLAARMAGKNAEEDGGMTIGMNGSAAKAMNRQENIDGVWIYTEKERKRNEKADGQDHGFIPRSWKLVKLSKDGKTEEELFSGVADFALSENAVCYTNGSHVYIADKDGKNSKKIADADRCLHVAIK